jgi:hypothetical protein
VNRQVVFFLVIQLPFSKFILVKIANVSGSHLLEELGADLLLHALVDRYVFGDYLG